MRTRLFQNDWLTGLGLLLTLPAAFFIFICVMKYVFGLGEFYDVSEPTLIRWGLKEFGWNVNALFVFGPMAAIAFTIFQVLQIEWISNKERFIFQFTIRKRWFPLIVTTFGAIVIGALFTYLLAENCFQHH